MSDDETLFAAWPSTPEAEQRRQKKHAEVLTNRGLDPTARKALEGDEIEALRLLALDLLAEQRAVIGGRCQGCDYRIYMGERYDNSNYRDLCMACTYACDVTGKTPNSRDHDDPWYQVRYGPRPGD